ncbi:fibrinogen silencer-binding protein-like [Aphis craccivora]|uniref:Regulatory protein zeste n=1 Tax=Aphis craccivora TaxID=307492 RepID=A0A6G0YYS7_APHCR|nr:fibrinogen silencer-binding protein-like [Aphis craccivora]
MICLNKKKRSNNFSFTEKELLLKIAISKKTVLENKSSNAVTWKDKEKIWREIAVQYNSQSSRFVRIHNIFVQFGN